MRNKLKTFFYQYFKKLFKNKLEQEQLNREAFLKQSLKKIDELNYRIAFLERENAALKESISLEKILKVGDVDLRDYVRNKFIEYLEDSIKAIKKNEEWILEQIRRGR